jgi:hypothetical protein
MMMRLSYLLLLNLNLLRLRVLYSFQIVSLNIHQRNSCLFAAAAGAGNVVRPPNEFSRTYQVERILGGPRQKDYEISIQANEEEREGLAKRFDLSNIEKLEAELFLRRDPQHYGRSSNRGKEIFVQWIWNVVIQY